MMKPVNITTFFFTFSRNPVCCFDTLVKAFGFLWEERNIWLGNNTQHLFTLSLFLTISIPEKDSLLCVGCSSSKFGTINLTFIFFILDPRCPLQILFSSVTHLCPTVCNPRNCGMPGFPVHHQLLEFTQTHVHWVGDAIQPSHPLSSPSPPAFNLSQHQGLFKWVSSSYQVAKV